MPAPPIAFVWFKEEQYVEFKELCKDGYNFPDTYSSWLSQAIEEVESIRAKGQEVHKVTIDIEEFREWSTRWYGQKFDADSRNRFASWKL